MSYWQIHIRVHAGSLNLISHLPQLLPILLSESADAWPTRHRKAILAKLGKTKLAVWISLL